MAQSLKDELLPPRNERSVRLFPMPSVNLCMPPGVVQSDDVEVTTKETKMSISDTPDKKELSIRIFLRLYTHPDTRMIPRTRRRLFYLFNVVQSEAVQKNLEK